MYGKGKLLVIVLVVLCFATVVTARRRRHHTRYAHCSGAAGGIFPLAFGSSATNFHAGELPVPSAPCPRYSPSAAAQVVLAGLVVDASRFTGCSGCRLSRSSL
jgi:hypothetical protein